jgi:hypothetical protein
MEHQPQSPSDGRSAIIDELVGELLVCSGSIHHMISGMIDWEMTYGSPPDAPSLAKNAQTLVSGAAGPRVRQSKRDLRVAAAILREITAAIREDIYVVNPDAFPDADLN